MLKIDAHQHFWQYNPANYAWINEDMALLKRDFMPNHIKPLLQSCGLDGCVVVQSAQTEEENRFQLKNAEDNDFIKGVIGWTDLQSPKLEEKLSYYTQFKKLKGFRHVLQDEPERDMMLLPAFLRGIALLKQYNFTYDILVHPDQLPYIPKFVAQFPEQPFVIDHIAKPDIKNKMMDGWMQDMQAVAKYDNVYCKRSGMVTEADWGNLRQADFEPYMDVVVNAFGTGRIMYGSDWPVCLLAADYSAVFGIVKQYFAGYSAGEQDKFFGGNAARFYGLA